MPTTAAPPTPMLDRILKIEVPIIVRLAERSMTVSGVMGFAPGSIIELPKNADAELDLMVNNKVVGCGQAVKVGENFGLKLTYLGNLSERIRAMGEGQTESEQSAEQLAEAILAGQR